MWMKTRTASVIITQVRATARVLVLVTAEALVRRIIIRSRYTQNRYITSRYIQNQFTMSRSTMIRAIMGTRVTAAEAITVRAMAAAAMAEAIMGADTDAAVSQWYRVKEGAAAVMAAALFAVL